MKIPEELGYTDDHEWVRVEQSRITIGITDYAQDALGDVVFVQVPELNSEVSAGDTISEVESTKSVSDIYAPVTGRVVEVNGALNDAPEQLNAEPYGNGWICVIETSPPAAVGDFLDAAAYRTLTEG